MRVKKGSSRKLHLQQCTNTTFFLLIFHNNPSHQCWLHPPGLHKDSPDAINFQFNHSSPFNIAIIINFWRSTKRKIKSEEKKKKKKKKKSRITVPSEQEQTSTVPSEPVPSAPRYAPGVSGYLNGGCRRGLNSTVSITSLK